MHKDLALVGVIVGTVIAYKACLYYQIKIHSEKEEPRVIDFKVHKNPKNKK